MAKCANCGYENAEDALSCDLCQMVLRQEKAAPPPPPPATEDFLERRRQVDDVKLLLRYRTGGHTHPELLGKVADNVLETLATLRSRPPGLKDGAKVRFGWTDLTLKARDGELLVCEPDYYGDAREKAREEMTATIAMTLQHVVFHKLVKLPMHGFHCLQTIVTGPGVLSRDDVVLYRESAPQGDVSGWLIAPADAEEANRIKKAGTFEKIRAYELIPRGRGHWMKALNLPPRCMALFNGDAVVSVLDPEGAERMPPP